MTEISRVNLFGKLNEVCYQTIESATVFCKLRTNPYVEIAHWLHQMLATQDSDLQHLVQQFELDPGSLARDLTSALDRLPRGASSISDLSTQVEESVERAWVYASLLFGESRVRTGHLLVGWLKTRTLRNALLATSKEFGKVNVDTLTERFPALTARSVEARLSRAATDQPGPASEAVSAGVPPQMGKQEALARYTIDLTERARSGEIDRVVGRDEEIRQLVQILMRRRQNNPILTGEAGVGKTAVVEGFAQRLASGDVPPQLKDVSLRALDIGLLQAGASMKGEFEGRLRQVIDEVQASPKPIILFVDEAHTLIGAGGAQGTGDAANLLKPALARGKLRTIGATTWAEYKKYIESDPALTRRFQVVKVDEPSEAKAVLMMRGTVSALESHHRVQILDEAIVAAVKLSKRYVPDRQLPDKSVSLLDTACARVAVSQHAVPAELEDSQRRIDGLTQELEIIARERSLGVDVDKRANEAQLALTAEQERLSTLRARFGSEKVLVDKILALRAKLRAAAETPPDGLTSQLAGEAPVSADSLPELRALEASLLELQGEVPLILPSVTEQAVALVVAEWTGIPTGRMVKNEIEAVLNASQLLSRRVVGQDHALDMISRRIQTARAGLENPGKPIGVFLLAGPSGVGKTETALALAEGLYGGEQNVITINMSEFQESHSVSTLKGAPPGYVGYGEGGVLTEAVRRRPYSVVLLDELEKAHPDVHEVFFQVFDKGFMEDGQGTFIDFKNTIILATSNVGSELILDMCAGAKKPDPNEITERLRAPMLQVFPAALLGRMVVIPYFPLGDQMLRSIIRLQLDRVSRRVLERYGVPLDYDQSVVDLVAQRCSEVESGGRAIDAVLTNSLLPQVSRELLLFTLQGKSVTRVAVGVTNSQFSYSFE
ncbi:MAG: type VI secretion system ATPase TssH [Pseudomonadota bacterium]